MSINDTCIILYFGSILGLLPIYRFAIFILKLNIITADKYNIEKLKVQFKDKSIFFTGDILKFFGKYEPGIKSSTVNWRIYNLVQNSVLKRIGVGKFNLSADKIYTPDITKKIKSLNSKLKLRFPFLTCCLWDTSVFNEFMLHQPGKFFFLVETEKNSTESVFYFLKENKYAVFHDPGEEIINKYMPEDKEPVIVKTLVSEAPVRNIDGVCSVSIEKMLVDIYCDSILFSAQQGSELIYIFKEALTKYTVNENRMLRYANRRGKKEKFDNFLNSVSKYRQ